MAATVFWIFNSFNKNYSTELQFPVRFEYNQDEYVPETSFPHQLKLNVSGTGWELFRNSLGLKLPQLTIKLEHPSEVKKIAAGTLVPALAGQLGDLKLNYVVTDTLRIALDHRLVRNFTVKVDESSISFRSGFGTMGPVKVTPSTVELDGPASVLNALPDTILLKVPATEVRKDFDEELEVPLFKSEFVKRNPPLVKVNFNVVPMTEVSANLNVRLVNKNNMRVYTADSIGIICRIPAGMTHDFKEKAHTMTAVVDLTETERGLHKLIPKVVGLPDYARVITVDSVIVKY
jgi:hypothetical protein